MKFHLTYLVPFLIPAVFVPDGNRRGVGGEPPAGVNTKAAAERIDKLIELDLKRAKLAPNALSDDATFLRRAYLGIIGRIPTGVETRAFLDSQQSDKRTKLIDSLLESPGYGSHMFNFWADLLRVKSRLNNQVSGEPFTHFIKSAVATNKPYDEFVREMAVAEGAAHAPGNGATGLMMRDRGMPLDSMANTVRVFLGTRLECAQCHDHPFDKWKQKDFYAMAAFAGGIQYRTNNQGPQQGSDGVRLVAGELRRANDRNGLRALNQMMRSVNTGVTGSGTGLIRLPKDYKYEDAKPNEVVRAHAIFGDSPKIKYPEPKKKKRPTWRERQQQRRRQMQQRNRRGDRPVGQQLDTRESFAEWLTSPKNPRFAKVIANRMWKHAMGRGLIEPVDNIMENTEASNPALMRYIEKLMVDVDFDLKKFQKILFSTTTFQRDASRKDVPSDQKYYFPGPVLRRMTAEQVWDSMLTFVVPEVDAKLLPPDARAKFVYGAYERLVNMSEEDLRKEVETLKLRYTDPQKFRQQQQRQRQRQQQERRAQMQEQQRKNAALRKQAQPIYRALIKARRAKDTAKVAELKGQLKALGIDPEQAERDNRSRAMMGNAFRNRGGRGRPTPMVRASDQPQPAPDGHFLRQFGQSDRDQIQDSHTDANVPQALSLLNGFVETRVLSNAGTELMKEIADARTTQERVRRAFLSILNREPRGRELAVWEHEIETDGQQVVKDLVWTLTNSHEFRFIR